MDHWCNSPCVLAQVRTVIKLGESLLSDGDKCSETLHINETQKIMRSRPVGSVPGEQDLLGEGEIVAVAAGQNAGAAEVAVAAGGGAQAAGLHDAVPQFGTEEPDPPPSPFTILFIGANVSDQAKLKLKEEYERLRHDFVKSKGATWWEGRVNFEYDCFADATDVMKKINEGKPTVLHFACHGDSGGVHLRGDYLASKALADAILAVNQEVCRESRIRLAVANTCKSGEFVKLLSRGIDFVVGHGEDDVRDEDAIKFSETLYNYLGNEKSLSTSFISANLSSSLYQLLAPRCDPSKFFLVPDSEDSPAEGAQNPNIPDHSSDVQTGDWCDPRWNEVKRF